MVCQISAQVNPSVAARLQSSGGNARTLALSVHATMTHVGDRLWADTFISEDLTIDGDIKAQSANLVIAGRVRGDIQAKALEIQPQGQVAGSITAEAVTIHGRQSGKISCDELALMAGSDVKADVAAKSMVSEKKTRLSGKVEITGE